MPDEQDLDPNRDQVSGKPYGEGRVVPLQASQGEGGRIYGSHILNFSTGRRCLVSFTPRLFYLTIQSPLYSQNRLGELQS